MNPTTIENKPKTYEHPILIAKKYTTIVVSDFVLAESVVLVESVVFKFHLF